MRALKAGNHICPEMQKDYERYGEVFEYEVVGRNNLLGEDHTEYTVMRALKTYDERFGYNNHDNAMKTVRNDTNYLTAKAIKEGVSSTARIEKVDEIGRLALTLSTLDEEDLVLIKHGAMALECKMRIEAAKERKAK